MTTQERFDDLVSNYLDEALDAEGMTELNTLLATRPDYATRFVKLSRIHGALRELAGPPPLPRKSRRWLLVVALAAAVTALLLGILFSLRRS
jgi:anti-sigma factor RsiW